jgi:hypothetical protein
MSTNNVARAAVSAGAASYVSYSISVLRDSSNALVKPFH